ncbi:hypothetical protein [Ruegeria atlantica]|uniref:Uncharacterized protein n=1 Tax=Ruegeria atlantica TaxID=81569 RepID=A0A0P1EH81_9RHOB|nr:hypothetical protein [Ruegeria atlantica]CUH49202.1 hypothetical protein RUA4292_03397 [Ruegeria atlantica]
MTDINLLELAFPDQISRIRVMRKNHRGFEALCGDFELLSTELERARKVNEQTSPCLIDPVTESLDGLAEEIAEHLSRFTNSEIVPKAISEVVLILTQARTKD